MMQSKELLALLKSEHKVGALEEKDYSKTITTGIVVDTDDPLQMGRLRVFCPNLNDDPKKIHHLPWAVYVPPFGGVVSTAEYARGVGKGPEKTEGSVAYGFWGIPEQGAKVIVACIDGDIRRRVWLGTMHEHQETHTLFHGRYKWSNGDGEPDGPLSSTQSPIEPLYTNMGKAVKGDRKSREWKTRFADYQPAAISSFEQPPNEERGDEYIDDLNSEIFKNESDGWVKPILGAHGYDWSGNKGIGSHLASRVFGFSTPGGHTISMDDRAYNSRIRIRSATGQQIILDDTNERIYMSTSEGASWIELDSNGNIDIFAERRVSVHAEKDINFSTEESFRVKAKKGIYMYAGETEGQESLDDGKPEDGEIRFHSTGDTHLMVEKNLRTLVKEDWLTEVGGKACTTIAEEMLLQVEEGIDVIVNAGDYAVSINGNYNHNATGNNSVFAGGDNIFQSIMDTKMFAFTGKMDIGSQFNLNIKAKVGDLFIEAEDKKSNLKIISNDGDNQIDMRNPAMAIYSAGPMAFRSAQEVAQQINADFGVNDDKEVTYKGAPLQQDCLRFDGGVNISFDREAINMEAVEDFYAKVDSGISKWTDRADTSIKDINANLEQIEENFNDFVFTTQTRLQTMVDNWLAALPGGFTIPALPVFPRPPSLRFPSIQLPNFNFDFCVEIAPLLTVERFDIIPNNMFGTFEADLGLLSKSTITNWVNRHKNMLNNSVSNIRNVKNQISASVDITPAIDTMRSNVESMRDALGNLAGISVTLGNDTSLINYGIGVDGFKEGAAQFNSLVDQNNAIPGSTQLDKILELQNFLESHGTSFDAIERLIEQDPSQVTSADFSDLLEAYEIINALAIELGDI